MVTTYTRHLLVCSGVKDFLSHRVAKSSLGLMTPRTEVVSIVAEHGQAVRSMDPVALVAVRGLRMLVKLVFVPLEGVLVATSAELHLATFQPTGRISCMGTVAQYATVPSPVRQMAVGDKNLLPYSFMTAQTCLRPQPALAMAFVAPFLEGLVQDVANQGLPAAAVWVVARKTSLHLSWKLLVALLYRILLVTRSADLVGLGPKKLIVGCLMGSMTGGALAFGKGTVRMRILLRQCFMAGETIVRETSLEQTL